MADEHTLALTPLMHAAESVESSNQNDTHNRPLRSGSPHDAVHLSSYWGEPERDPHDAVYGDLFCLSVCLSVRSIQR